MNSENDRPHEPTTRESVRITKTVEWDKRRRGWRVRIAMGRLMMQKGTYTTPEEASYVGDAVIDYGLACWRRDGERWA